MNVTFSNNRSNKSQLGFSLTGFAIGPGSSDYVQVAKPFTKFSETQKMSNKSIMSTQDERNKQ